MLFAQDAGNAQQLVGTPDPLLPIPFLFYFMIWLPQQQQEKKRRAMIEALKKNDKVVTAGGIYGTVVSVDPDQDKVVLRIDDDKGVKLTFTRSSVVRVLEASSEKATDGRDAEQAPCRRATPTRVGPGRRPAAGGSRSTVPCLRQGAKGANPRAERTIADDSAAAGRRPQSSSSIARCRPQDAVGGRTPGLRNDHETVSLEDRPDRRVGAALGLLAMCPPTRS